MNNDNPAIKPVDNYFAAIMTFMLPGLGQLLKGQIMPGIFWALAVGFGYFAFTWPGLIIHIFCILDAAITQGEDKSVKSKLSSKFFLAGLALALIVYAVIRLF